MSCRLCTTRTCSLNTVTLKNTKLSMQVMHQMFYNREREFSSCQRRTSRHTCAGCGWVTKAAAEKLLGRKKWSTKATNKIEQSQLTRDTRGALKPTISLGDSFCFKLLSAPRDCCHAFPASLRRARSWVLSFLSTTSSILLTYVSECFCLDPVTSVFPVLSNVLTGGTLI